LTRSSFKVFAAHDADTDTSANGAHADDEARCQCDVTEDVFHSVHIVAPKMLMERLRKKLTFDAQ
jgi:hypothetical protein